MNACTNPHDSKHPNDMDAGELLELVKDMSWAALDLAQHLSFTNDMLREDLRPNAYKRAEAMAYELSHFPYAERDPRNEKVDAVLFGENGLERLT